MTRRTTYLLASCLLLALPLSAKDFDRPRWSDEDKDCRDTRAEVLAQQCRSVTWDPKGCRVRQAVCLDIYSGAEVATDSASSALQVDHIYPASVAWRAREWRRADGGKCVRADACAEFQRFFDDAGNLLVTRSRTNGRKSDRMPAEWCPATRGARMLAAKRLRRTAAKWRLPLSREDEEGLKAWERGACAPGAVVLGGGA